MKIVSDSKKVLRALYNLLNENSYELTVEVHTNDMAANLNITRQHLNLCIHYLISSGYIEGSYLYDYNENSVMKYTLTAFAINKIENDSL